MPPGSPSHLVALDPRLACPGGAVSVRGVRLLAETGDAPQVTVGAHPAHVVSASNVRVSFRVPPDAEGGVTPVRVSTVAGESLMLDVGRTLASGIHLVDSPVFDASGRLYVTVSGARGQQAPVSVFRVDAAGRREPFASGIVNATSMAFGPDRLLYVTSRFEGVVYRVSAGGEVAPVVTELGVACGLAFAPDGTMFIGDRSGTLFRARPGEQPSVVATLPPSVAAYHLAVGGDGWIYVSIPTLSSRDHVYRVSTAGAVEIQHSGFGRPQGLAFDVHGHLHVVEALAGASGVYRLDEGSAPTLVAAGEGLVGVTFDPGGALVTASNDAVYGFSQATATATTH
jgi:sugar lactone lactonase YvrE